MRGVAGQEDPAAAVGVGHADRLFPGGHADHRHRDVVPAERGAGDLDAARIGEVGDRGGPRVVGDADRPAARGGRGDERGEPELLVEHDPEQGALGDDVAEIGVDDDAHPVLGHARAGAVDAGQAAQRAGVAVGRDQVVGPHCRPPPGGGVGEHGAHPVGLDADVGHLGVQAQVRAPLAGRGAQQRLDGVLVGHAERRRAGQGRRRIGLRVEQPLPLPRQGLAAGHAGVGGERAGRLEQRGLQAEGPVQLHRPLVDPARPPLHGAGRVPVGQDRRDAVRRQEHRGRQARVSPADDQHGGMALMIRHVPRLV